MPEARRYYYKYAIIDKTLDNMCIEVRTQTDSDDGYEDNTYLFVRISVDSDDYIMKYYDRTAGRWYHDKEMQNEWQPPTA